MGLFLEWEGCRCGADILSPRPARAVPSIRGTHVEVRLARQLVSSLNDAELLLERPDHGPVVTVIEDREDDAAKGALVAAR